MSPAMNRVGLNRFLLLAVCTGSLLLSAVASADDDRRRDSRKHRGEHSHSGHSRADDHRDRRHSGHRSSNQGDRHGDRWDRRAYRLDHERRDWHYHQGRYWAPPKYRGRQCSDRRHHHGVHYHVRARDYYDYYYPRYRYYGPRPHGADASVIITIPLF